MRGGAALSLHLLAKDAVVTLGRAEGYGVLRSCGHVSGTAMRPYNLLRATFRSLGAFVGLSALDCVTDAERAREEALDQLRRRAGELGAEAVIDLRFRVSETQDGSTRILAYGEAVVLARAARES
ncbi:MAG: YbjQ family protein [Vulcanimicrobiaceae bacterium]